MQTLKSGLQRLQKIGQRSWCSIRTDWDQNHLFEIGTLNPYKTGCVSLMAGTPGPYLLKECCEMLKTATDHRMKLESENNGYLFQYGPAVGLYDFRVNFAKFLSNHYNSIVQPSDLVVTSGASIGLHIILSTLIDMSGVIFVDNVTYMCALDSIMQYTDMTIVPVPLCDSGPDMAKFEELIVKHKFKVKSSKLFWGMYYAIPIYHNPTGKLFSNITMGQLLKLARKHDFLITCDDVYNLLHYSGRLPKRLFAYDNLNDSDYKGNVISNGSFSKILSPGLRIGWMECPPRCLKRLRASGYLESGGSLNNYTSGILTSLIELGLMEKQLKFNFEFYKRNMIAVCDLLRMHLPRNCRFTAPHGGYFVWIEMPDGINGHDFFKYSMERYKVAAFVGDKFSITKNFNNCLRISIGFYELDTLTKAVKNLCTALDEFFDIRFHN